MAQRQEQELSASDTKPHKDIWSGFILFGTFGRCILVQEFTKHESLEGIGASEVERDMGLFREALDRHYSNVELHQKFSRCCGCSFIHSFPNTNEPSTCSSRCTLGAKAIVISIWCHSIADSSQVFKV